jgi:excisionase family DNA binding protein
VEKLLTTTELADAIGASESSMRRWTNDGVIGTSRTAGGHRRIALSEAIRFIRESGTAIVRPDVLGLPNLPATHEGRTLGSRSLERQLFEALRSGDAAVAKGCVTSLFLNGSSVSSICDGAMQRAMQQIGELWREDPRGILIEHRATDICLHALGVLRQLLGEPAEHAPVALGGAPEGDPYLLPSLMAAIVLAEAGYRDMNFGPDTPLELLATAADDKKPRIVWLAVKSLADRTKLHTKINALAERLGGLGINLAIGGSAVEQLAIRSSKNVQIMQNMNELSAFARGAATAAGTFPPDSNVSAK